MINQTVAQRIAQIQTEGNEAAQFALMDAPAYLAAVEDAFAAGARWSRMAGVFFLAMPGCLETLVAVHPSDDTADFGSGIDAFLR